MNVSRRDFTKALALTFPQIVFWEPPHLTTPISPMYGTQKLDDGYFKVRKLENLVNAQKPKNLLIYKPDNSLNAKGIEVTIRVYHQNNTSSLYNISIEYDMKNRPYLLTVSVKPVAEENETGEVNRKSWMIMDDKGLTGKCTYGYIPPALNNGVESNFDENAGKGLEFQREFNERFIGSIDEIIKAYEQ